MISLPIFIFWELYIFNTNSNYKISSLTTIQQSLVRPKKNGAMGCVREEVLESEEVEVCSFASKNDFTVLVYVAGDFRISEQVERKDVFTCPTTICMHHQQYFLFKATQIISTESCGLQTNGSTRFDLENFLEPIWSWGINPHPNYNVVRSPIF